MVVLTGANIPAPTPTLTYVSYGAFTITNYDATLTYTVSGSSSRTGSTFNVTSTSGSGSLSSTTPKGTNSPGSVTAYRLPYGQTYIATSPVYTHYSTSYNGGTYYAANQWSPGSPAGFYAVYADGYYVTTNYSGSGYTFNSTYNEWWKIV